MFGRYIVSAAPVAAITFALRFVSPANAQLLTDPIPQKIVTGLQQAGLKTIATGLISPVDMEAPNDGSGRLFVVEQTGQVRVIQNGTLLPTPALDLSVAGLNRVIPLRTNYDERGLLGMAFDPNFNDVGTAGYHRVFTYDSENPNSGTATFSVPTGGTVNTDNVLSSWKMDANNPNVIDPNSRQELMRIQKPSPFNHDGGHLAFGPDGKLYLGLGDGGSANDTGAGHNASTVNVTIGGQSVAVPLGNAQDTNTVLGKMLRIDVNGTNSANGKYGIPSDNPFASGVGGLKEIFATGFRNPYRFSFDSATGALLAGDVGQNQVEEVDKVINGGNYGWHYREGSFRFDSASGNVFADPITPPAGVSLIDPVLEYDHNHADGTHEGSAVIGGFVYRGSTLTGLQGQYIFGDLGPNALGGAPPDGRLFYADPNSADPTAISELNLNGTNDSLGLYLKGFGQDSSGNIYVLGSQNLGPAGTTGEILELVAVPEPRSSLMLLAGSLLFLLRAHRRSAIVRA